MSASMERVVEDAVCSCFRAILSFRRIVVLSASLPIMHFISTGMSSALSLQSSKRSGAQQLDPFSFCFTRRPTLTCSRNELAMGMGDGVRVMEMEMIDDLRCLCSPRQAHSNNQS